MCPNMIHVDALDFSEWHSEEVISFFWRSVYVRESLKSDLFVLVNYVCVHKLINIHFLSFIRPFMNSLIILLVGKSVIHSLIHWVRIHSINQSFSHSFIHVLIHSFIHSFIHLFIYSFSHSFNSIEFTHSYFYVKSYQYLHILFLISVLHPCYVFFHKLTFRKCYIFRFPVTLV